MNTSKSQRPLVSVIILNWNGLEDTLQCLKSVRSQSYTPLEVIIVDNGSSQDQKDVLKSQKDIVFVDNPVNRGFTGGHIDGYRVASGDFILLLNNDALLKANYIEEALKHFDDPSIGVVGGRSYFWNEEAKPYDEANEYYTFQNVNPSTGEAFMQTSDNGLSQEVNNVSGSAVIVRKTLIEDIGYLHEPFFAYFEETDLFARAKRAHYKVVYDPELRIWHKNGASSGASSGSYFFYYMIFRNRFIFAMRNFESSFVWPFLKNYLKLSLLSVMRLVRHPDEVMNVAYMKASVWNLLHLLSTLRERSNLKRTLGPSKYNTQLIKEQTGVSIVIDCTNLEDSEVDRVAAHIETDTDPLHEYVLVTRQGTQHRSSALSLNRRYVVAAAKLTTHPVNLGCVAARFPWMIVTERPNSLDIQALHQSIAEASVASRRCVEAQIEALILTKDLYEEMGGLPQGIESRQYALDYAALTHSLATLTDGGYRESAATDKRALHQDISYNRELLKSAHPGPLARAMQKYYRLYQFVTISKWIFIRAIPIRLKAARIRNLLLFTLRFRMKLLATEFKHIRNEVILFNSHNLKKNEEMKIIRSKLTEGITPGSLPVYIICRDRLETLEQIISWLEAHKFTNIILIDNDSSYPPLTNYLERTPYQVLRLYRNIGHTSPWRLGIVRSLTPQDFYLVTDPDVIPTERCPEDVMNYLLSLHEKYPEYLKIGLGLKIDDLPNHYPLKKDVIEWESQFWTQQIEDNVYEAGVDTTFALYKPFTYKYTLHPSLRVGEPYTARHLPWYGDPRKVSKDEAYYRYRANHDVSSWNAGTLPERYKREMGKT